MLAELYYKRKMFTEAAQQSKRCEPLFSLFSQKTHFSVCDTADSDFDFSEKDEHYKKVILNLLFKIIATF